MVSANFQGLHGYTPRDLKKIDEKTQFETASDMVLEIITPKTIAKIDPALINHVLENDFKGLPFTGYIISTITADNLNSLRPIVIRHLLKKAEKPTAQHFIKTLQKNPWILLSINPEIISLFLMTASNDYASEIARLITPATLPHINPTIILDLITSYPAAVGVLLIPLITPENFSLIHTSVKQALSRLRGYSEHINEIKLQLNILENKHDMEQFMDGLKKKRAQTKMLNVSFKKP
jgi:hypothetical protein